MISGWMVGIAILVAFGVLIAVDLAFDRWWRQWRSSERRRRQGLGGLEAEVRAIERKKDADV